MKRAKRWGFYTLWLYVRTISRSFRWTLLLLALALVVGSLLYRATPHQLLGGQVPPWRTAIYGAWMALFAQPIWNPPETWYLSLMCALYPLLGFVLVGEGIVRLSLLMLSREHGEKDWMKVMASTYRDHVVLCGLGHLGYRILAELIAAKTQVVAIEKNAQGRFVELAKATGVPILVRDMKDDQTLIEASVPHARCIIIATDDDVANLEVALDARRLNPKIKILMRMFDQQIADKIKDAFAIDQAFSPPALAAPIVAAMSVTAHGGNILASFPIAGVPHMAAEIFVGAGSPLDGRALADIEQSYRARVVAHLRAGAAGGDGAPAPPSVVGAGDTVVVHAPAERMPQLMAAGRAGQA